MSAVALDIRTRPRQAIGARIHSVGPEVRPPCDPRRDAAVEIQIARARIDATAAHLIDLRLHDPLHRECRFVCVRLGIQIARRISRIDPAGDVDDPQIRIMRFHRAQDVAHLRDEQVGI